MSFVSGVIILLALGVALALLGGAGLHLRIVRLERALARAGGSVQGAGGAQRPQVLLNKHLEEGIFRTTAPTVALFVTEGCAACITVTPEFDRLANDARYAEVDFVRVTPFAGGRSTTTDTVGARLVEVRGSVFSELAGPVVPSVIFRGTDGTVHELGPVGSGRALEGILQAIVKPSSRDAAT